MSSVGRNQPCPCGSGKKFKKCGGALAAKGPETAGAQGLAGSLRMPASSAVPAPISRERQEPPELQSPPRDRVRELDEERS